MADQQYCLRWNNHQSTLISVFDSLQERGCMVDCTLAAEGQSLQAHKVVLSACSPYLEDLLSKHYDKHPILLLKDVKFEELKAMMDYMYRGEVNVAQDKLNTFLRAAESLQIKGLSDGGTDPPDSGGTTSTKRTAKGTPVSVRSNQLTVRKTNLDDSSSRDGSTSPSQRKRRRRRGSETSDIETSNVSDGKQSTAAAAPVSGPSETSPIVPASAPSDDNILSSITESAETENATDSGFSSAVPQEINNVIRDRDNVLIEPKTEYLEEDGQDLNLEDEDGLFRAGPSHARGTYEGDGDDDVYMTNQDSGANAQVAELGPQTPSDIPQNAAVEESGNPREVSADRRLLVSEDRLMLPSTSAMNFEIASVDGLCRESDLPALFDIAESDELRVAPKAVNAKPRVSVREDFSVSSFGSRVPLINNIVPEPSSHEDIVPESHSREEVGWCQICHVSFSSWLDYLRHCSNSHMKKNKKKSYLCNLCGNIYPKNHFGKHQISHSSVSGKFVCSGCPAEFLRKRNVNRHWENYHTNSIGKLCGIQNSRPAGKMSTSTAAVAWCIPPREISENSSAVSTTHSIKDKAYQEFLYSLTDNREESVANAAPSALRSSTARPYSGPRTRSVSPSVKEKASHLDSSNQTSTVITKTPTVNKTPKAIGFCWVKSCKESCASWEDYCKHYIAKHVLAHATEHPSERCLRCLYVSSDDHVAMHEALGNAHQCEYCSAQMITSGSLASHVKTYHRIFT